MSLKQGEISNKEFHRCTQTQCEYFLNGGCQACDTCKAEPYEIRKKCHSCFKCEKIPNNLRWGNRILENIKNDPELEKALDEVVILEPTTEERQKEIILELMPEHLK